jgi:hypothetical protein
MPTLTLKNGDEYCPTTVLLPRNLKDFARRERISMSKELREALEAKMKEGDAGGQQLPANEAPCIPSSTDKQVEQECSGIEQAPTSQPAAPSSTPRRSKGQ